MVNKVGLISVKQKKKKTTKNLSLGKDGAGLSRSSALSANTWNGFASPRPRAPRLFLFTSLLFRQPGCGPVYPQELRGDVELKPPGGTFWKTCSCVYTRVSCLFCCSCRCVSPVSSAFCYGIQPTGYTLVTYWNGYIDCKRCCLKVKIRPPLFPERAEIACVFPHFLLSHVFQRLSDRVVRITTAHRINQRPGGVSRAYLSSHTSFWWVLENLGRSNQSPVFTMWSADYKLLLVVWQEKKLKNK